MLHYYLIVAHKSYLRPSVLSRHLLFLAKLNLSRELNEIFSSGCKELVNLTQPCTDYHSDDVCGFMHHRNCNPLSDDVAVYNAYRVFE